MDVDGKIYRTVWSEGIGSGGVKVIDQRGLPWELEVVELGSVAEVVVAIREMWIRGAGCIGAVAGYGMWLAAREAVVGGEWSGEVFAGLSEALAGARPTAVNLRWAVERVRGVVEAEPGVEGKVRRAFVEAEGIAEEDVERCRAIGEHGVEVLREISERKGGGVVNVLTHCNAGWLAFVDFGSATAPIYRAVEAGIDVHVWVDETRPRNQGARLTAWELGKAGVKHTVVADNVGGHLMQRGMVDVVITGTDRTTYTGDVANKVGTYLKALAARDNGVPFYVALPSSTFDWEIADGVRGIPIEERGGDEVGKIEGLLGNGEVVEVGLVAEGSAVANWAFDVTPARLVTGLITERGVCAATEEGVRGLFPEGC